jgi:hypothetical protein
MPERDTAVTVAMTAEQLRDGVLDLTNVASASVEGCQVYMHYNGPTDQLDGICAGMAVLAPGASPHPPHRHPEEEFLIVSDGTGEIECDGKSFRQVLAPSCIAPAIRCTGSRTPGRRP